MYLVTILAGMVAQGFISNRLVVDGDAAATAHNILTHRGLFQLGFAVYLVEMAANVAMTSLFYELLQPVSRSASLAAAFLGLAGCTIKTFARVFYIAPLFVLGGEHYLSAFSGEQLQSIALLMLDVNDRGAGIALAFFGFAGLLKGWLILRSTFLPRILGAISLVASAGWLTFVSPTLGFHVFLYIAPVGLLGSVALIGWLLVFGVNEARWKEQARASGMNE